jgi:hypothetical protein
MAAINAETKAYGISRGFCEIEGSKGARIQLHILREVVRIDAICIIIGWVSEEG